MVLTGPVVDIGDIGAFLGNILRKEDILFARTPLNRCRFLTISYKNIFKTQDTRLNAKVIPNKSLEWVLIYPFLANAPILYPVKTPEKPKISWRFQGV